MAAIGIDLGTTWVRAAYRGKVVRIPSAIAFGSSGRTIVGAEAVTFNERQPERTVLDAPRLLGRRIYGAEAEWLGSARPNRLVSSPNGDAWVQIAGLSPVSPQELCAHVVRSLIRRLEAECGPTPKRVVVAIPSMLDVLQRRALVQSLELVDLEVEALVASGATATLAAGVPSAVNRVVVADFGGGTFDLCMLERRGSEGWTVKGAEGDLLLGGNDLDHRVLDQLVATFHGQHGVDLSTDPQGLGQLWRLASETRVSAMTGSSFPQERIEKIRVGGRDRELVIPAWDRRDLEVSFKDDLDALWPPCSRLFEDARLGTDDIDALLLLGGAATMSAVRGRLEELFRCSPITPDDADTLAVRGATLMAERGDASLVTNLWPHTLGVKGAGGKMRSLLRRNRPLPISNEKVISTGSRNALRFDAYQGESEHVRHNSYFARFEVSLRGASRVVLRLKLDALGRVEMRAEDSITAERLPVEVKFTGGLTKETRKEAADRVHAQRTDVSAWTTSDEPASSGKTQQLVGTAFTPPVDESPSSPQRTRRRKSPTGAHQTLPWQAEDKGAKKSSDTGVIEMEADSLVGTTVGGRYRIDRVIADGGMGRVYHAKHEILDREVAVKVIHPELAAEPSIVKRFLREAQAAASIQSEHVVSIHDFGSLEDGAGYFVMEYLEGRLLGELLDEEGPLPGPRMIHIASGMANALEAAHRLGIVHRDLKPDNVLLTGEDQGYAKIFDFGIAKAPTTDGQGLTQGGDLVGTPAYMAPEQIDGRVDGRTDIYALGVVMFEMITGEVPFYHQSVALMLRKHLLEPAPTPSKVVGVTACPPELDAIILRCLEKAQEDRFEDAKTLRRALSKVRFGGGSSPSERKR